jgi:hypothetical protein
MKVMVSGFHLIDRIEPAAVEINFVKQHRSYEVRLGHLPIAAIEETECGFRIRTMSNSAQLCTEFVSLHATFCAMEHLIQCGGSAEWARWSGEVRDCEHQEIRIKLEPRDSGHGGTA